MPKLRVHNFAVSVDGFAAGPNQSLESPLGVGGDSLHEFMAKSVYGQTQWSHELAATPGLDDQFLNAGDHNIGAHIMGRHMFTNSRGE